MLVLMLVPDSETRTTQLVFSAVRARRKVR
jgi:hypothetical protein